MNCSEAKNKSIVDYLKMNGIQPQKVKNNLAWYNSPIRNESTPSFKVDISKNLWYDHGIGQGGSILDLVMKLQNTDVRGALSNLQGISTVSCHFSSQKQKPNIPKVLILHVGHLSHPALFQYLNSRKISPRRASRFVNEVHYQINHKKYFGIGFPNDEGAYELRNKKFKGGNSPKAVTTIKGFSKALNIFEGFMDFLSALEYYNIDKPANTTVILNSVNNLNKILHLLNEYSRINLYLDNDDAGINVARVVRKEHSKVENFARSIYPENKDFNDYLINIK